MAATITDNFRVRNAADFVDSVTLESLYMFIGKIDPWADDANPPLPFDSVQETEYAHWEDMLAAKRITALDIVHMIPRNNWTTNTVYTQYDPADEELRRSNFTVINSNYDVYKCIDNNGGGQSTVEPTGTGAAIFTTGDGYAWKYMYTVQTEDALRFVSSNFIPVRQNVGNVDNDGPGLAPYPTGGHGADNFKELGAYFVGINVQFTGDEGGSFTTKNDYRKVGLVNNPTLYGTTTVATDVSYRQSTVYTLTNVTGTFVADEIVEGNTPSDTARVVEYNATSELLTVKLVSGTISTSDTLTGAVSGAVGDVSSITDPELELYSGEMLFVEYKNPTPRDPAQTESVTLILQF